jgi:hypothetical protein
VLKYSDSSNRNKIDQKEFQWCQEQLKVYLSLLKEESTDADIDNKSEDDDDDDDDDNMEIGIENENENQSNNIIKQKQLKYMNKWNTIDMKCTLLGTRSLVTSWANVINICSNELINWSNQFENKANLLSQTLKTIISSNDTTNILSYYSKNTIIEFIKVNIYIMLCML